MVNFKWLFTFLLFFSLNDTNENNFTENILKINQKNLLRQNSIFENNQRRKLEEYKPIRIFIETGQFEYDIDSEDMESYKIYILDSIKKAENTITQLFNVQRLVNGVNLSDINDTQYKSFGFSTSFKNNKLFTGSNEYDLIIFIRRAKIGADYSFDQFGELKIIKTNSDGRPIAAYIIFNLNFRKDYNNLVKTELYSTVFLHMFIHILGFMDSQFNNYPNKESIFETKYIERIKMTKKIVKSENIKKLAKQYFGEEIDGLELDNQINSEGLENSHWDGRILLGDIMTPDIYFQETVISEFTLALLEESGWYTINYYTGGLMKYGKNKKKKFFENDCIRKENNIEKSLFSNEFCTQSYGTCSSGRLSRGYCYLKSSDSIEQNYSRYWLTEDFKGSKLVEYCPVSNLTENSKSNYYIGNCKIGNNLYGKEIAFNDNKNYDYNIFNNTYGGKYGNTSFCAISSILEKNDNNQIYKGLLRPTCYSMSCSNSSLTIKLNDEFIVCPREGGMIKIGKEKSDYTNYKGYLFCPDYNLICTGSVICNNLFDCVEKKSEYKKIDYDYVINNVTNEITFDIRNETELDKLTPNEGYELSNDNKAICPVNCCQCISNKRCILCRNFTKTEPHAYYIGEINDENSHINCSESKPDGGYYEMIKYNHIHYFRCTDNCNNCTGPTGCNQCLPKYILDKENKCVDRIPNCIKYNTSSLIIDYINNGGGYGYEKCEQCDISNTKFL